MISREDICINEPTLFDKLLIMRYDGYISEYFIDIMHYDELRYINRGAEELFKSVFKEVIRQLFDLHEEDFFKNNSQNIPVLLENVIGLCKQRMKIGRFERQVVYV